jgi:hypothetical protein
VFDQRQESRGGHAFTAVGEKRMAVTSNAAKVEVVSQGVDCPLLDNESSAVLGPGLGQQSSSFSPDYAVGLFYHPNPDLTSAKAHNFGRPQSGVGQNQKE